MPETKTVLLLIPVEVAADGKHCGGCGLKQRERYDVVTYCGAWGGVPLTGDREGLGLLRCPECLSAEQHPAAAPQPEQEPSRVYCPICAPGPCRCEEDRR